MGLPRGRSCRQLDRNKNFFKIQVKLVPTDEVFTLNQVHSNLKISELKADLEFFSGLPAHIQRISYLDAGDLLDNTDMRVNDIVPGATLHMRVWPMWTTLVESVAQNDIEQVMGLGVTHPTEFRSAHSDYMSKKARQVWLEERAAVALSMAASRGLHKMCARMIEKGADVNAVTKHGRTALHIASAQGHGHIVDLLLEKGADIDAEDDFEETALSTAERFGFKSCGRHLFLFHWQQRAKKVTPTRKTPLMLHQKNDSLYPVWKRGKMAQLYMVQHEDPGEFEGTGLGAPKKSLHPSIRHKMERDGLFCTNEDETLQADLPPLNRSQSKPQKQGRPLKKPESHKEWLEKILHAERKASVGKRKMVEEQKRKQLEEEERKQEAKEELGYESWLASKMQQEKADGLSHPPNSPSNTDCCDKDEGDVGGTKSQTLGYLRVYLRSLGRSQSGVPYEDWLDDKEREVRALSAGKTAASRAQHSL